MCGKQTAFRCNNTKLFEIVISNRNASRKCFPFYFKYSLKTVPLLLFLSSASSVCFQNKTVQHKLAEMKTNICVGRAFLDNCLQLHSEKRLDSPTASMAKYWYVVKVIWKCYLYDVDRSLVIKALNCSDLNKR